MTKEEKDVLNEIWAGLIVGIIIVMGLGFMFLGGFRSCEMERNKVCFEQTKSVECWGMNARPSSFKTEERE
jgi:hypothetical protein